MKHKTKRCYKKYKGDCKEMKKGINKENWRKVKESITKNKEKVIAITASVLMLFVIGRVMLARTS